jgi:uncharacterized protein YndB with AHSA1/START domain
MELSTEPTVERHVELDATPEEVWAALGAADTWLADEGDLVLETGAECDLTEDGRTRRAVVEEVDDGRRVVFRWWSTDGDGDDASRVEITLTSVGRPTLLVVRETRLVASGPAGERSTRASAAGTTSASSAGRLGRRWELRLTCLAFLAVLGLAPV